METFDTNQQIGIQNRINQLGHLTFMLDKTVRKLNSLLTVCNTKNDEESSDNFDAVNYEIQEIIEALKEKWGQLQMPIHFRMNPIKTIEIEGQKDE